VSTPHVLIVAADASLRNAVRAALADLGCVLHVADGVAAARDVARSQTADVVLFASRLPDLSGTDPVRLFGQSFPASKRIMLSDSRSLPEAVVAVAGDELFHVLEEPLRAGEVRAAVEQALGPEGPSIPVPERIRRVAALHEKAKRGILRGLELSSYHSERGRLLRALLASQPLRAGQTPRRSLRVNREFPAIVRVGDDAVRTTTLDVSTGGFAVRLPESPDVGAMTKVVVRLPEGDPIHADVQVANLLKGPDGSARVGYRFVTIDVGDARRLELAIFDALIERMQG